MPSSSLPTSPSTHLPLDAHLNPSHHHQQPSFQATLQSQPISMQCVNVMPLNQPRSNSTDKALFLWSRQSSHRRRPIQMVNHHLNSLLFCALISQDSFLTYLQAIPHRLQLQLEQPISIISFHLTLNMTQHSTSWMINCLKTYYNWSIPVWSEQSGPLHFADFIQHFAKKDGGPPPSRSLHHMNRLPGITP